MAQQFQCKYLGSVPITPGAGTTDDHILESVNMLWFKLCKLQQRAVKTTCTSKYGRENCNQENMAKIAKKLRKQGQDVTCGDSVDVTIRFDDDAKVEVRDPVGGGQRSFNSSGITGVKTLPPASNLPDIVGFIDGSSLRAVCHVVKCQVGESRGFGKAVAKSVKKARVSEKKVDEAAESFDSKKVKSWDAEGGDKTGSGPRVMELGVGLSRTSSVRVGNGGRRAERRTINLSGGNRSKVKRRSNSYGNSFNGLGSMQSAADPGASFDAIKEDSMDRMSTVESLPDDDLLSDLDESLFGDVDTLNEDFMDEMAERLAAHKPFHENSDSFGF